MTTSVIPPAIQFRDQELIPIWEKVKVGQRLDFEDGLACLRTGDIVSLGQMGDYVKRKLWGDKVYFTFNRQINPTNICVLSCTFCDFAKKKGDADAYEMGMDEIFAKLDPEMQEVHIVGGHHPDWPFERYEGIIRGIHQAFPNITINPTNVPTIPKAGAPAAKSFITFTGAIFLLKVLSTNSSIIFRTA